MALLDDWLDDDGLLLFAAEESVDTEVSLELAEELKDDEELNEDELNDDSDDEFAGGFELELELAVVST